MNDLWLFGINDVGFQKTAIVMSFLGTITLEGFEPCIVHGIEHVIISNLVVSSVVLLGQVTTSVSGLT